MDVRDTIIQRVTAALQAQGQQGDVITAVQDVLVINVFVFSLINSNKLWHKK